MMAEKYDRCPHGKEWPSQGGYDMQRCNCPPPPDEASVREEVARVIELAEQQCPIGRAIVEYTTDALLARFTVGRK